MTPYVVLWLVIVPVCCVLAFAVGHSMSRRGPK